MRLIIISSIVSISYSSLCYATDLFENPIVQVEEKFQEALSLMEQNRPLRALDLLTDIASISDSVRINLETGKAFLHSGEVLQAIKTYNNVLENYLLPTIVRSNIKSVITHAEDRKFKPYINIDGGIDGNPYRIPKKQEVILFAGLPMTYDPGEKTGSQGYLTTTIGSRGDHSRLFNYDFYVQNTSYESSKDLSLNKYGLKVSSLWGDDTTHIRTTVGANLVNKYEQVDGIEYDAGVSITPDVFVTSPTTISGSYLTYQSDDSQTDYNLSTLSISKRYQFDNANFVTPSIYADFYEPLRSTGAYKSVRAAIEYPFMLQNMNLTTNVSFEDRRYRNRDFMFGTCRSDQTSVVSVTIPINDFYFTIGYEQLESSIRFYDYSRYTVKTGASIH